MSPQPVPFHVRKARCTSQVVRESGQCVAAMHFRPRTPRHNLDANAAVKKARRCGFERRERERSFSLRRTAEKVLQFDLPHPRHTVLWPPCPSAAY
eukprot:364506-Chlamydomonas_euryale.AAC.4